VTITIILAEDHPLLRSLIKSSLQREQDFSVVGEASTGLEAVALIESTKPDVAVLDIGLPLLSGLDAIPLILARVPQTAIIIYSLRDETAYASEALARGAARFVSKRAPTSDLVNAIRTAVSSPLPLDHYLP
jgi:DNA-binding NarL/FixJ family response regulator